MHNKNDKSRSNFDNTCFDKNLTVKNKSTEIPQFKVTRKIPPNTVKKKGASYSFWFLKTSSLKEVLKISWRIPTMDVVFRKALHSERSITVMKHPGCSTEDMTDYIKSTARKKPDTILLHMGTNDLTKSINAMKKKMFGSVWKPFVNWITLKISR